MPSQSNQPVSGAASTDSATPPSFELSLSQLEHLVQQLEAGELPLDQALKIFEQGVQLTRECQTALGAAQQKVQVLLQRGDQSVLTDFEVSGADDTRPD